jgi:hypothetical protein
MSQERLLTSYPSACPPLSDVIEMLGVEDEVIAPFIRDEFRLEPITILSIAQQLRNEGSFPGYFLDVSKNLLERCEMVEPNAIDLVRDQVEYFLDVVHPQQSIISDVKAELREAKQSMTAIEFRQYAKMLHKYPLQLETAGNTL